MIIRRFLKNFIFTCQKDFFRDLTRKAQTLLEYSLLIAVTVASLLFMQAYVRRNLQGFLKQHADNLGGEKVTPERFTPGRFFGASQAAVARNWAFEYEGRKGFGVTIGGSRRTQLSKLIAPSSTLDIPSKAPVYETQFEGKDTALMENIESSAFNPQRARLDEEIERQSEEDKWENTKSPEMDEGTGADIDSQAEALVNYGQSRHNDSEVDKNREGIKSLEDELKSKIADFEKEYGQN